MLASTEKWLNSSIERVRRFVEGIPQAGDNSDVSYLKGNLTLGDLRGLLAALEHINEMACYASEEDTDSRPAMLLRIGETARGKITAPTGDG